MPYRFHIDEERRLVEVSVWGTVTAQEVLRYRREMTQDARFCPDFSQLVDFREVAEVKLSAQELQELAQAQVFSSQSRRAYVVARPVIFGLVRMFEAYREMAGGQEKIRLFHDREEAMRWVLGSVADP